MPSRVVAIVQARMGSARLPGKVLRRFGNAVALEHQLRRLTETRNVDEIVVATTQRDDDGPIVDLCHRLSIRAVRGSSEDVLDRFRFAAEVAGADVIVRLTADCPLIDPHVVDRIIEQSSSFNYTSNSVERSFPRGLDAEAFHRADLEAAAREATDPYEREHVTPFFYRRPDRFACSSVRRKGESLAHWRWTLDEPRDEAFLSTIFEQVGERLETEFDHEWLVDYLRDNPAIAAINACVRQKQPPDTHLQVDGRQT